VPPGAHADATAVIPGRRVTDARDTFADTVRERFARGQSDAYGVADADAHSQTSTAHRRRGVAVGSFDVPMDA
jgi:hypothetical protein